MASSHKWIITKWKLNRRYKMEVQDIVNIWFQQNRVPHIMQDFKSIIWKRLDENSSSRLLLLNIEKNVHCFPLDKVKDIDVYGRNVWTKGWNSCLYIICRCKLIFFWKFTVIHFKASLVVEFLCCVGFHQKYFLKCEYFLGNLHYCLVEWKE